MADPDEVAKKVVASPPPRDFTADEWEALREVARAYIGLKFIGKAANLVKSILTYIGWAAALFLMWKAGFIDWIRGIK